MNAKKRLLLIAIAHTFCFVATGTGSADERSWCQRTWAWITSPCSKPVRNLAKKKCRACVENWYGASASPDYGLTLLDRPGKQNRLVIFVHGLNSRPEDLQNLISETQDEGIACATFRYPNDQSVAASVELFASEIEKLQSDFQECKISIVAHSMGCLVSRAVVESNDAPSSILQLVMLTPPNHGSALAKYACSLDLWEYATSGDRRDETGFIVGAITDGLAEATDDLEPDSKFLTELNRRPRNKKVDYTIVVGTKPGSTATKVAAVQNGFRKVGKTCSWMECVSHKLDKQTEGSHELILGKGDGFVSVQSAMLDGVDDVLRGHFSHNEILHSNPSDQVKKVRRLIVERLASM